MYYIIIIDNHRIITITRIIRKDLLQRALQRNTVRLSLFHIGTDGPTPS